MRRPIPLSIAVVLTIPTIWLQAQQSARFAPDSLPQQPPSGLTWAYPANTSLYAQGWTGYGYPGFGANVFSPYDNTPHFPYLYFYEQYAREAEESRRAADECEAALAREGKLTGPLEVGAFATDFAPCSPLNQQVTLDGQLVDPSPSGAPLVIESGSHTLQIGALAGKPEN